MGLGIEDVLLPMEEEKGPEGGSLAGERQEGQTPDGRRQEESGAPFRLVVGAQELGVAPPCLHFLPHALNQCVRKKVGCPGHGQGLDLRSGDVANPGKEDSRELTGTVCEGKRGLFKGVGVRQQLVGPGEEGGEVGEPGQPVRLSMAQRDVQEGDDGEGLSVDHGQGGRGVDPKFGSVLSEAMQFAEPDVRLSGKSGIQEGSDPKILRLVVIKHPRGEACELFGGGVAQDLRQPPVGLHDGAIFYEEDPGHGVFKERLPKIPVSMLGGPGLDPGNPQGDPSGQLPENGQDLRGKDPGRMVVQGENVSDRLRFPHGQDHKGPQSIGGEGLDIEGMGRRLGSLKKAFQALVDQGSPRGEGLPGGAENSALLGVGGDPDPVEIAARLSGSGQNVKKSVLSGSSDPGQGEVGLFHGQIADFLKERVPVVGQGDLAIDLGQKLGELRELPEASLPGQPVRDIPGGEKAKSLASKREGRGVDLHRKGRSVLFPVERLEGELVVRRKGQGSGDVSGELR